MPESEQGISMRQASYDEVVSYTVKLNIENSDLRIKNEKVVNAAKALIDKIKEVEASDQYKSVWVLSYLHGAAYTGPNYGNEFEALEKVLTEIQG
jgi:hypothetical protein